MSEQYHSLPEHARVFLRPELYLGGAELRNVLMPVVKGNEIVMEMIEISPALHHMFIEIIINSADNVVRSRRDGVDPGVIRINTTKDTISVYNEGNPMEVRKMKSAEGHDVWVVSEMYESCNSGSNYDDNEERETAGRNGVGAGTVNALSKTLSVEVCDHVRKKTLIQTWTKPDYKEGNDLSHMSIDTLREITKRFTTGPTISLYKEAKSSVKVTYSPCFSRFGMKKFTPDWMSMFEADAHFLSYCARVPVYYNNKEIDYSHSSMFLYVALGGSKTGEFLAESLKGKVKWTFCVINSADNYSFVNGTPTRDGGCHINALKDGLVHAYFENYKDSYFPKAEDKDALIKTMIREEVSKLRFCVKITMIRPEFRDQTKEQLTTRVGTLSIAPELVKKIADIKQGLDEKYKIMQMKKANETLNKPKNDKFKSEVLHCNNTKRRIWSEDNCLNIMEGKSARTYMKKGLQDAVRNGYYAMTGKCLNISDVDVETVMNNKVLRSIIEALGLKFGIVYEKNSRKLKYCKIRICSDQDVDGFHIQCLLLNMFATYWPCLIKNSQVSIMNSPIVRASKGEQQLTFYTMSDYEQWKKSSPSVAKGWSVVYCKGLGSNEAEDLISDFSQGIEEMVLKWDNSATDSLSLAFSKKDIMRRKNLLSSDIQYEEIGKQTHITISDLIYSRWRSYSEYNIKRAIPSFADGLKVSERKILFIVYKEYFNKPISKEKTTARIELSALAGKVIKDAGYHHGEVSLHETETKMTRGYPGASNLPLLYPAGEMGTRDENGDDHAAARYTKTFPRPFFYKIFRKEDDPILPYTTDPDSGKILEPDYFLPVIPLCLVNNPLGIGSGWSTSVPPYDVDFIISVVSMVLSDKNPDPKDFCCSYRYYDGKITTYTKGLTDELIVEGDTVVGTTKNPHILIKGVYDLKYNEDDVVITIHDIPPGYAFIKVIEAYTKLEEEGFLKCERTDDTLHFRCTLTIPKSNLNCGEDIEAKLYLKRYVTLNNMYLLDTTTGLPKKYHDALTVVQEFVKFRIPWYKKRKEFIINKMQSDCKKTEQQIKLIKLIHSGQLNLYYDKPIPSYLGKTMNERMEDALDNNGLVAKPEEVIIEELTSIGIDYDLVNLSSVKHSKKALLSYEDAYAKMIAEIDKVRKVSTKKMMYNDLVELHKLVTNYYSEPTIDIKVKKPTVNAKRPKKK